MSKFSKKGTPPAKRAKRSPKSERFLSDDQALNLMDRALQAIHDDECKDPAALKHIIELLVQQMTLACALVRKKLQRAGRWVHVSEELGVLGVDIDDTDLVGLERDLTEKALSLAELSLHGNDPKQVKQGHHRLETLRKTVTFLRELYSDASIADVNSIAGGNPNYVIVDTFLSDALEEGDDEDEEDEDGVLL